MKVLLFGATGMIGQGVLRECLLDPQVAQVLSVGRRPTGQTHPKLREILHGDLQDYSAIEGELSGLDACCFCLGVTSAGLSEEAYQRITLDATLAAATPLARLNPQMAFCYISGAGADSTERGRVMWARVKGRTENALLRLPFKAVYLFRPGAIRPLHGITSRTKLYRILYALLNPLFPLLKRIAPDSFTTTEQLGRAMLHAARDGAPKTVLETADINRL
ncbi:MAG: epimerase [Holophagaceae bacterium]|uniref:Epimerase n=1 Tax=Candidatus Geothrix skivensis TaxID=2954439 RepID=A0A9D7SJA4_9BACT|nr:epimerase [Candidatus Geothrix skivensis]